MNSSTTSCFSLTARQGALLRFIAGYIETHEGIAPSYGEMVKGTGGASKNAIHVQLRALEERGYIRRIPSLARAIELLAPVAIPRLADGTPLHVVPLKAPVR